VTAPARIAHWSWEGRSPVARTHPAVHRAELVDPLKDGRWEAFVAREPGATVFHHRAYLDLLDRAHGYPLTACCLVDRSATIRAGVPLALVSRALRPPRLVSLPFTDRCGLLPVPDGDPGLSENLAAAVDDLRRSTSMCVEVRGPVRAPGEARVSAVRVEHEISLCEPVAGLGSVGTIPSPGLRVERRTDMAALTEYRRLSARSRWRHGVPIRSRRTLVGLAHMFDRGLGFLLRVGDGARIAAGAVFLTFNGVMTCRCAAVSRSGSDIAPLDALLLEAMRWGTDAGMHALALGCTDVADDSRRRLWRSWGARERLLEYHEFPSRPRGLVALAGGNR
jgi:hypothetical protein